jgi:uncharacterized membrane protein YfhO
MVDGKPTPIYRADVLFRGVPIEPGKHTIIFEYQPVSFRVGAVISVTSILTTIGLAIVLSREK